MNASTPAVKKKDEELSWARLMKQIWKQVDVVMATKEGITSPETQKQLARLAEEEVAKREVRGAKPAKTGQAKAPEHQVAKSLVAKKKESTESVSIETNVATVNVDSKTIKAVEDLADMMETRKLDFRKWCQQAAA